MTVTVFSGKATGSGYHRSMRPPAVELTEDLRDRLTAAADHLEIHREWVERGDVRCNGRDFGFWSVRIGLHGWQDRIAAISDPLPGYAPQAISVRDGALTVEGRDLAETLRMALNTARERWPESAA
jgi:hypothetical protein